MRDGEDAVKEGAVVVWSFLDQASQSTAYMRGRRARDWLLPSPAGEHRRIRRASPTRIANLTKMAIEDDRTEVPDSEEEPMTSSPIKVSENNAHKLCEDDLVSFQDRQGARQSAGCSHQAHAKHSANTASSCAYSLDVDQNDAFNDIDAPLTDARIAQQVSSVCPFASSSAGVEQGTAALLPDSGVSGMALGLDVIEILPTTGDQHTQPGTNSSTPPRMSKPKGSSVQTTTPGTYKKSCIGDTVEDADFEMQNAKYNHRTIADPNSAGPLTDQSQVLARVPDVEAKTATETSEESLRPRPEFLGPEVSAAGPVHGSEVVHSQFGEPGSDHLIGLAVCPCSFLGVFYYSQIEQMKTAIQCLNKTRSTEVDCTGDHQHTHRSILRNVPDALQTELSKHGTETGAGSEQQTMITGNLTIHAPAEDCTVEAPQSNSTIEPDLPGISTAFPQAATKPPQPTIPRTPQEIILAELKSQKAALLVSLAALPAIQVLIEENECMDPSTDQADDEPTESEIMTAANKIVKEHIKLLHEYNELKDVGQGLMGLIADQRGIRIIEVQDEFGINAKD